MNDYFGNSSSNKILNIIFWILVVIVGIIVISPLIDKLSSKLYKSSLENEEIDFEDMGPEIVVIDEGERA